MRKVCSAVLAAILYVPLGPAAMAHDIAVFPSLEGDRLRLTVRYGHPGDYPPTSAGKLVELVALSPDGSARSLAGRLRPEGNSLVSAPFSIGDDTAGTWVISAFYDNGFYLRTTDGRMVQTTLADYPAAGSASHNYKYGKALVAPEGGGPGYNRAAGHRLEIVPTTDPFAGEIGDALELSVLFDGAPLADASVYVYPEDAGEDIAELKTNADGRVSVARDRGGRFLIGTSHAAASRHPQLATRDVYAATLVFNLDYLARKGQP